MQLLFALRGGVEIFLRNRKEFVIYHPSIRQLASCCRLSKGIKLCRESKCGISHSTIPPST
jgi:hypothetical protein